MNAVSSGTAKVTLPTDEQILITREFDAPKQLVYTAWTTPELVKRWWAGQRGKVTLVEIDLRVGGRWRYAMIANEGFEVAFHGEYLEIVPDERIVNTEMYEGMPEDEAPPEADAPVQTVTFSESGGRTAVAVLMECKTKELRDMIIESGMEVGLQEAMDALEQVAISLR